MLEADSEYISIVLCHLDKEQVHLWVQTQAQNWNSFFIFLEQITKDARQMQVWENFISGVGPGSSKEELLCKICEGDHLTEDCRTMNQSKSLQLVVGSNIGRICEICGKEAHTFVHPRTGEEVLD